MPVRVGANRARVCLLVMVLLAASGTLSAEKVPGTKSGFVTTPDGVKIHYLEAGPRTPRLPALGPGGTAPTFPSKKPPLAFPPRAILFVPGWTMPAWIWEQQIEHFSESYRVVAMDPRCQGESSQIGEGLSPMARARDIKAVVEQLHLAPVVVVAWSMAVGETVAYVDQFGTQDIAGLVLVDDAPGADVPDAGYKSLLVDFIGGFVRDRRHATDEFVRSWFKKPQPEKYIQRVIQASLRTPTSVAVALLAAKFGTDLRPALAKIDRPTLICASGAPYQKIVTAVQSQIPGSRLEIFEDGGHALFVDDSDRFNSLLDGFLTGLER